MRIIKRFWRDLTQQPDICCICGERVYHAHKTTPRQLLEDYHVINDYSREEYERNLYILEDNVTPNAELRICHHCRGEIKSILNRDGDADVRAKFGNRNTHIPKWKEVEWAPLKGLSLMEEGMIAMISPACVVQQMNGMLSL